jgi:hypothetical protein
MHDSPTHDLSRLIRHAAGHFSKSVSPLAVLITGAHMSYWKWLLAGLIGAAIGGAIWVAVGYFGHLEVGWIAWGVGLLAGVAVRMAAGETEGYGPGIAALIAAVAVVAVSKYVVVELAVNESLEQFMAEGLQPPTEEQSIAAIADMVAGEYEAQNKPVQWPASLADDAPEEAAYPAEIWAEAKRRWQALSPEEQQRNRDTQQEEAQAALALFNTQIKQEIFKQSFSPWDLLWFGLAAWTAFKVGSGLAANEG